jgi:tetratricopeptide (TPR) repeat protein
MKTDAIAYGVSGILFGLIAGWIIGSHQGGPPTAQPPAPAPSAQSSSGSGTPPAAVVNEDQVKAFKAIAEREPSNVTPLVQLGNLYFDAERYDDASQWYLKALKLAPNDVDVNTDLGICYYSMNEPDKALEQFAKSLAIDPKHTKTLLNVGVVRAFGKQDLDGAQKVWQTLVDIAPDTPEGKRAKQMLDALKSHPAGTASGL